MEELLHFAWKHRILPIKEHYTTHRLPLEVLDPGLSNPNAGPDFTNAKIKIGDTTWIGNVELHVRASDWYRHKHETNPAYDTVILHVVSIDDVEACNSLGEPLPQFVLAFSSYLINKYNELKTTDQLPRCYRIIPTLSKLMLHSWMNALQSERLEMRTKQIQVRLKQLNGNWEDCFFVTLARNFGFGINGDAFEQWALHIPLRAVDKHRDNLLQIEAIFFGQAGLLELEAIPSKYQATALNEGYFSKLRNEYLYLAHKFSLHPINFRLWKFLRLRPANFPHIRISQLAQLYYLQQVSISQILEAESVKEIQNKFTVSTNEYWETHFTFGAPCEKQTKRLQKKSVELIIINTISPFLFAYGKHRDNNSIQNQAIQLLENLPPENNFIMRMWTQCGFVAQHAGDAQALIQLKKEYCDPKKCLRCRIGYKYLTLIQEPQTE